MGERAGWGGFPSLFAREGGLKMQQVVVLLTYTHFGTTSNICRKVPSAPMGMDASTHTHTHTHTHTQSGCHL